MNLPVNLSRTAGISILAAALLISSAAPAQSVAPVLSIDEIISKLNVANAERAARLHAYRSTRVYENDYKGFGGDRHAKMTVEVNYRDGSKAFKILSEGGSGLLLKHVLHKLLESEMEANTEEQRRRTALNNENYSFTLLGIEVTDGRNCYVEVKPRRKEKFLYDGRVWIDAQEFAVVRIVAKPAKNPSFWITKVDIEHRYTNHAGIWLPASNRSESRVRFGGHALLTIDYGKYDPLE